VLQLIFTAVNLSNSLACGELAPSGGRPTAQKAARRGCRGFTPRRLHAAPESCRPGKRASRMGRGSVPTVAPTFSRRVFPSHPVKTVFLHNVNLLSFLLDF